MDGWFEEGWSEKQAGGTLSNQCFSMRLGRFKRKFATEQDVKDYLETANGRGQDYYRCPSCDNFHTFTKNKRRK